jgi:hypothetical protein
MLKKRLHLDLIFEFTTSKLLDKTAIMLRLPNYRRRLPIRPRRAAEIFSQLDQELQQMFTSPLSDASKRYEYLFRYLLTGFIIYRGKAPSLVNYYGLPSWYDARVQSMEGFSRFLPLICGWLSGGRPAQIQILTGEVIDLEEIIREGLLAGTDRNSPGYWGDVNDYNQRICESAFLALSLRLIKDTIWKKFTPEQKQQIIDYLLQANGKNIRDNNWYMFPTWINKVTAALGFNHDEDIVRNHFDLIKSFYRGEGWFTDGLHNGKDRFDYYNIFIFHFFLFWLTIFEPQFEGAFIQEAMGRFLETYLYLLSPAGIPFLGRSIPYRMALTAPAIAGCLLDPTLVKPGLARRAFDTVMTHFIAKGAIARGNVTQGYYREDLRWLDRYIGPASGLISLFSFVLALRFPFESSFWTDPELLRLLRNTSKRLPKNGQKNPRELTNLL